MKKILLFLFACLTTVCVYANTCTYNGVQVTLYTENIYCSNGNAYIRVTVSDKNVGRVRCQVECAGKREWIDIDIDNGQGSYNLAKVFPLYNDMNYNVKLIAGAGQCY